MQRDHGTANSAPAGTSLPPIGERYRLQDLIGRGGMGSVYRAYDTLRECTIALKRLDLPEVGETNAPPPPQSTRRTLISHEARQQARRRAQLVALFQREYHTLAQLAHPRIIEVYDYGLSDGRPFYTMELLEGHDLSHAAPLPWRTACSILRDVGSALTLLHARRMLHRDVSPRNVLCSPDGMAKLLDFGAMTPMGVSPVLVGTPAFVAPEAAQRQALDARSDLYSLGALGYLLLTGRPPYRVHGFGELRDAYRTRPQAPSAHAADVPKALDALVMQLIQIDRAARPGSAVEVVERLGALAGLAHDPRLAVASAYLSTPTLVGRQTELVAVRRRALRAQRGHGASMIASGVAGVGRSRFLDACALEGKLAGALVLRSDPTACGGADYGVARALLMQAHAALTDFERRALPLPGLLCDQLLPGLAWASATSKPNSIRPAPAADEDTAVLTRLLNEYFVRLAQQRPLMITVDDMHAIDSHSAALLAGLAQAAAHCKLVIVAACDSQMPARAEAALRMFVRYSRPLQLAPLHETDIEALLRSVFGDVPNLAVVSSRLHALSHGNPSLCMELARHLIDNGLIRYESGGFVLPERLAPDDLPESFEQVLRRRFARLSLAARELGATLSLSAGAPLRVEQCALLSSNGDPAEGQRALSELVAAEVVLYREDYVALRQHAFGATLLAELSEAQVKTLHMRLAALLAEDPALRMRAADHFLRGENPSAALDLLLGAAESDVLMYEWFTGYDALMERALAACDQLGRRARDAFMLRRARAYHRMQYLESCDRQQLLGVMHELERMTGLTHYRALDPALDPQLRLSRALEMIAAEYAATPEKDQIYPPLEAITELTTFVPVLAGYATSTFDVDLLDSLCSLEPYIALSPAIEFVHMLCRGLRELRAGQHEKYLHTVHALIARLEQPDGAGLPARRRERTRMSLVYVVALTDGALGSPRAFERAAQLDALPRMRGNAWRVRQIANLYRGEVHKADECRRQVELLLIQDSARQAHQGTTLETEFMCYARSDDLLGLRRALPELEHMAAQHVGWRPVLLLGRAELERIRGNLEAALELCEQARALVRAGRHMMWPHIAALRVRLLTELGRAQEAKDIGVPMLAECIAHGIDLLATPLTDAVVDAELVLGEYEAAIDRLAGAWPLIERLQVSGVYAGQRYELRARLALRVDDLPGFARYFELCTQHYGNAVDSPFTARLSHLANEARALAAGMPALDLPRAERVSADRIRRELAACLGVEERARCALALLLESAETATGHLYGVQNGRLSRFASCPTDTGDESVARALENLLDAERWCDADATQVVDSQQQVGTSTAGASIIGSDRTVYTPFAITVDRGREQIVVAVAALARVAGMREPTRAALTAIGEELFVRGDITGFTLVG